MAAIVRRKNMSRRPRRLVAMSTSGSGVVNDGGVDRAAVREADPGHRDVERTPSANLRGSLTVRTSVR